MNVVHVGTTDAGNGAAIAAYRIHEGLRRLGVASTMFVAEKHTDDPDVRVFEPPRMPMRRIRRRLRRMRIRSAMARYRHARTPDLEAFSDDRSEHEADVPAQLPASDIVHVHALLGFVDYQSFFATVPRQSPVVRTLHDMSFFTGGCHYDGECGKFTQRCGACPQLGSNTAADLSRQIWERKAAAFAAIPDGRLHLVATSRWLAGEAQRSRLLRRFPVTVIPHGIDTEVFRPRDREQSRNVLGIDRDARVVLFVAEPITRRIKGFPVFAEAMNRLGDLRKLMVVSVGNGHPPVPLKVPHLHLGRIRQERLLSLVYSAADVFVMPSLQEAFGLTALEAIACGVPVVGSAVGGILDTVRPGVTGMLVPPGDAKATATAIADLLDDPATRQAMAVSCRRVVLEEYTLESQAKRYARLYEAIVDPQPRAKPRIGVS